MRIPIMCHFAATAASVPRLFASEASSETSAQLSLIKVVNIFSSDSQTTLSDFSNPRGVVINVCEDLQPFESLLFGHSLYDG
jgi:hypothetical protein